MARSHLVLISACLAGLRTRYDGSSRPHPRLTALAKQAILVPVCPEILGGMGIPRPACRFQDGDGEMVVRGLARVVDENGSDRTSSFIRAGKEIRHVVKLIQPDLVIFKEGSPSCGLRRVEIEGRKTQGCGVATAFLKDLAMPVVTEEDGIPWE